MNAIAHDCRSCSEAGCQKVSRLLSRMAMLEDELYERNQSLSYQTEKTAGTVRAIYEAKIAELEAQISSLGDDYRKQLEDMSAKFRVREIALKEKVRDQEQELRMFRDTVPGSGQSEKFSGNGLDKGTAVAKKDGKKKPRSGGHGGGRNPHEELKAEDENVILTPEERTCEQCGNTAVEIDSCESSEEVELEVIVRRKRLKRQKYRGCSCGNQPSIMTAPLPAKAMIRSAYSDLFWIELCLFKFDLQMPVGRFIRMMEGLGLMNLSSGTLSDGLLRLGELIAPIDKAIIEHNLNACFWQADETRLAVFEHREGRSSFNWTLWQIQGNGTVVYQLTPTREAVEIQAYFADVTDGVILSDRAKVYQTLWFPVAFCWVHVRRDFIKLGRYTKGNRTWAIRWLRKLRVVFRLYRARAQVADDASLFSETDRKLRQQIGEIYELMKKELADTTLKDGPVKVLTSLENHWEGLILFLDNHDIPIDNNAVERLFRPVANLRKASYGCHSEKAGHNTARMLTILQTLKAHGIAPREWMVAWLGAIAENNGIPPEDITPYLPWEFAKRET